MSCKVRWIRKAMSEIKKENSHLKTEKKMDKMLEKVVIESD